MSGIKAQFIQTETDTKQTACSMAHCGTCFVCNAQTEAHRQPLTGLKSQHSDIPITVLIRSILRHYHSIRDVDDATNVICLDCLERFEHCDLQRLTAKRCERELFDLLVCTEKHFKSQPMTIVHTLDLLDSDDSSSMLIPEDAIKPEPNDDSLVALAHQSPSNELSASTGDYAEHNLTALCTTEYVVKRGRPRIHPVKQEGARKPGRPRIHPPKPKNELKKRGRPRIHPEKPPGERRRPGRPPKNPPKLANADGIARNRDRPIGLPLKALLKAEYSNMATTNIMIKLPMPNPLHARRKANKQLGDGAAEGSAVPKSRGPTGSALDHSTHAAARLLQPKAEPGVAKKRGRPPKIAASASANASAASSGSVNVSTARDSLHASKWTDLGTSIKATSTPILGTGLAKKRGRPPKNASMVNGLLSKRIKSECVTASTANDTLGSSSWMDVSHETSVEASAAPALSTILAGIKRKRGRPRKHPPIIRTEPPKRGRPRIHPVKQMTIPKRRGRPPKYLQNYVIPVVKGEPGRPSTDQSYEPFPTYESEESLLMPLEVQIKSEPETGDEADTDSFTQQFRGFSALDELEHI